MRNPAGAAADRMLCTGALSASSVACPPLPTVAVPESTSKEPVGGVGHLMDEGIDPLPPIPLEHEIYIQGELDHIPPPPCVVSGDHLPDPRSHPIAQANRDVRGKTPIEAGSVQVGIETLQIDFLLGSSTARSGTMRALAPSRRGRPAEAMLSADPSQLEIESLPHPNDVG
jgi:hypothetical protein